MVEAIETKSLIQTSVADGHRHEWFLPEGPVAAGDYQTGEADGHFHSFTVAEDLDPGDEVAVTTGLPVGEDDVEHQHELVIRAVPSAPESRSATGRIIEVKQLSREGVNLGIIRGYVATWDEDTGGKFGVPDQFVKGAFAKSIAEHRARGNRPIRMKDAHGKTIGGFPIETVREDEVGLMAVGEINLDTQLGRETYSLARQGVLSDLSVGFIARKERFADGGRKRLIEEADIVEGSIVDEPANRAARILEVKAVVPYQDLPLADRDRAWDADQALGRVRSFTGSEDAPSADYRKAFLWHDSAASDDFGSYKLPIADVVGGRLVAIPRGVFAAAGVLSGARGGVDVPATDRAGLIRHVERYYSKMDMESPFSREERQFVGAVEAKSMTVREVEESLCRCGGYSKGAARVLAGRMGPPEAVDAPCYDGAKTKAILQELHDALESLRRS